MPISLDPLTETKNIHRREKVASIIDNESSYSWAFSSRIGQFLIASRCLILNSLTMFDPSRRNQIWDLSDESHWHKATPGWLGSVIQHGRAPRNHVLARQGNGPSLHLNWPKLQQHEPPTQGTEHSNHWTNLSDHWDDRLRSWNQGIGVSLRRVFLVWPNDKNFFGEPLLIWHAHRYCWWRNSRCTVIRSWHEAPRAPWLS